MKMRLTSSSRIGNIHRSYASIPARPFDIDYEPWFALSRRYDKLENTIERRNLDGGFTLQALDPFLKAGRFENQFLSGG